MANFVVQRIRNLESTEPERLTLTNKLPPLTDANISRFIGVGTLRELGYLVPEVPCNIFYKL